MVDTIWGEARRLLGAELSAKDFETWVEPLRATGWSDGELTVEVPSGFFRERLKERHLVRRLERALEQATGGPATVLLQVNRALDVPARHAAVVQAAPAVRPKRPPASPRGYTFDTFVVGASNQVAFAAAQDVVASPGVRFNPLFVYGGCGLGKTHLLTAVTDAMNHERPSGQVLFLSAENFVNEMIVAIQSKRMTEFHARFRGTEMLVVDDVQFLIGKQRSQQEFLYTFKTLHRASRQIVLASDRPPRDMLGLDEKLRDRFASGLLADVQPPDADLRRALVERKAAAIGVPLTPELVGYMAEHWCTNVRVLEGALTRLYASATLSGRPVTRAAVEEALAAHGNGDGQGLTVARIVNEVCREYRLSRDEIASPRRTARVAVPRQVAMYLCRHHTDAPLATIGADLGGRDHSTVAHALKAIERRLQHDMALRQSVAALQARLQG